MERLAEEQAAAAGAWRRSSRRGAQPNEVFWAVSDEGRSRLFGTELAAVGRFEPDPDSVNRFFFFSSGALDLVGADRTHERWGSLPTSWLRPRCFAQAVPPAWMRRAGSRKRARERPSACGASASSRAVASPIVVEGELLGRPCSWRAPTRPLPVDTEERLEKFTELVATAIANAESREARAGAHRGAGGPAACRDDGGTRRHRLEISFAARPPRRPAACYTRRKRHDGSLRHPDGQRYHACLVGAPTTEAAFPYRQCGGRRRATKRRVDGAPDRPAGSYRRLSRLPTDPIGVAAREAGHEVGGWKPDRRRRAISGGRHDGYPRPKGGCRRTPRTRLASFTELVATADRERGKHGRARPRRAEGSSAASGRCAPPDRGGTWHDGVQQTARLVGARAGRE